MLEAVAAGDATAVDALRPGTLAEATHMAMTEGHLFAALIEHLDLDPTTTFAVLRDTVLANAGRPSGQAGR